MIYDDEESQKKFEPRFRLVRVSLSLVVMRGLFSGDLSELADIVSFAIVWSCQEG